MTYNYLLDLYRMIEKRHAAIAAELENLPTSEENSFRKGQLEALGEFTDFLHQKYHTKLPRRAQKTDPRNIFKKES